jgi:hypothetical protein
MSWRLPIRTNALCPRFVPLELPGCEAANVDVELVEAWIVAIVCELNLELQLVFSHR